MTDKHRFKTGDKVVDGRTGEWITISQFTNLNGWAAYYSHDVNGKIADADCRPVPQIVSA